MKRNRGSERGSSLLEFALGWSVFWALFAGVYQFGYTFYIYNVLMTSVANAAEMGAKMNYDTGNPSGFTTAVQNMVVYGDTVAGTRPVVPNLSTSNVNVNLNLDAGGIPHAVTVSVNYRVDSIFSTYTFNGKPRATAPYLGRIVCASC